MQSRTIVSVSESSSSSSSSSGRRVRSAKVPDLVNTIELSEALRLVIHEMEAEKRIICHDQEQAEYETHQKGLQNVWQSYIKYLRSVKGGPEIIECVLTRCAYERTDSDEENREDGDLEIECTKDATCSCDKCLDKYFIVDEEPEEDDDEPEEEDDEPEEEDDEPEEEDDEPKPNLRAIYRDLVSEKSDHPLDRAFSRRVVPTQLSKPEIESIGRMFLESPNDIRRMSASTKLGSSSAKATSSSSSSAKIGGGNRGSTPPCSSASLLNKWERSPGGKQFSDFVLEELNSSFLGKQQQLQQHLRKRLMDFGYTKSVKRGRNTTATKAWKFMTGEEYPSLKESKKLYTKTEAKKHFGDAVGTLPTRSLALMKKDFKELKKTFNMPAMKITTATGHQKAMGRDMMHQVLTGDLSEWDASKALRWEARKEEQIKLSKAKVSSA